MSYPESDKLAYIKETGFVALHFYEANVAELQV
jgi:hypothetical protein